MDRDVFAEKLSKHGIRKTAFRMELLELFSKGGISLTQQEIRNRVTHTTDKVTIYRALDSFEEKGIIHRVPDVNNITRYALCKSNCSEENHTHNHLHFICEKCEITYCLNDFQIPKVQLDPTYTVSAVTMTMKGVCKRCH